MDDLDQIMEPRPDASVGIWVLLGVLALVGAGAAAYLLLKPDFGPAPGIISDDPMLAEGWRLYQERCSGCHGETGRGDGPIGVTLAGTPPGNLIDGHWKYGDRPEDVLRVLEQGVAGSMPGWRGIMTESQLASVAAFVYHLDGREIPADLRTGWSGPTVEPDLFAEDDEE